MATPKRSNTKEALNSVELITVGTGNENGGNFEEIIAYYQFKPSKTGSPKTRVLAQNDTIDGTYEGSFVAGKYKKMTHKVRTAEGLVALPSAGRLDKLMARVAQGATVKVTYRGKTTIETGEFAGSEAHNFLVRASKLVAEE